MVSAFEVQSWPFYSRVACQADDVRERARPVLIFDYASGVEDILRCRRGSFNIFEIMST